MKPLPILVIALLLAACDRDPAEVRESAAKAMSTGDYAEAEDGFRWLVENTPDDPRLRANLAFALTRQAKHEEALPLYTALVTEGVGTYDLFAHYATSLDGAGRTDDAIVWSYRALSVVPQLVDVRGDLAKRLVKRERGFEALSLLASFDAELEARGQNPYFQAQRIAIASTLPAPTAAADTPNKDPASAAPSLQAVKLDGHFYTVVTGNDASLAFLIDTGATHTTVSRQALETLGLSVPPNARQVSLTTADGRTVRGRQFTVPTLQVGPYALADVQMIECGYCASLLGQSTLERFDLQTRKTQGLEVLTMRVRQGETPQ